MPKKILTIGLLSVPVHLISGLDVAKRNVLKYHNELKNVLSTEVKDYLKKQNIELRIINIQSPSFSHKKPISMKAGEEKLERTELKRLAKKLKKEYKKYDQILVLGGGHHAAWPLYHLPGKVAYVDKHLDAYFSSKIGGGSYLDNVVKKGIKKGSDIYVTGQSSADIKKESRKYGFKLITPAQLKKRKYNILDIDVDAFPYSIAEESKLKIMYSKLSKTYSRGYSRKELQKGKFPRISDIGQAIMHVQPRVVALSEINPGTKRAKNVMKALVRGVARLSAIAAAERKFGIKLFDKKKYKQISAKKFFRDRSKKAKASLKTRIGRKVRSLLKN